MAETIPEPKTSHPPDPSHHTLPSVSDLPEPSLPTHPLEQLEVIADASEQWTVSDLLAIEAQIQAEGNENEGKLVISDGVSIQPGALLDSSGLDKPTASGHPDQSTELEALKASFIALVERADGYRDPEEIEQCIALGRKGIELTMDGDPSVAEWLSGLGRSLCFRYEASHNRDDIEESISSGRKAIELTPDGDPCMASRLSGLGRSLFNYYERLGDPQAIEESIIFGRRAIDSAPDGHLHLPAWLGILAVSLMRSGNSQNLDEPIALGRRAIELAPDGHPRMGAWLNNLGTALRLRFQQFGNMQDLEDTILVQRRSLTLTPDGHPQLPISLSNLGFSLQYRFEQSGNQHDLEESVALGRRAIDLRPDGDLEMPFSLDNLGNSLFLRFRQSGDLHDLEDSIALVRKAIELTPDGHPYLPLRLNNLGEVLLDSFEHSGNLCDLDESILLTRRAVALTPDGSPDLALHLDTLGKALHARFEHSRDLRDLEQSIAVRRRVIDLGGTGTPYSAGWLCKLGRSLKIWFEQSGDLHSLEESINLLHSAVDITPPGHPGVLLWQIRLGESYRCQGPHGSHNALAAFRIAALTIYGFPSDRFSAAKQWAQCCRDADPSSFTIPYALAMDLLTEAVGLHQPIELRHANLNVRLGASKLVAEAVATAVIYHRLDLVVEWLEQARCLIWTQLNQLRLPLEDLATVNPSLAQNLHDISRQLERAGTRHRGSGEETNFQKRVLEEEASRYVRLADERKQLLEDIRKLPGFDRFLKPRLASYFLERLPQEGPIILVNAHEDRCDAIALFKGFEPLHIPLPDITLAEASRLQADLQSCVLSRCPRTREVDDRGVKARFGPDDIHPIYSVLEKLWTALAKPVLDAFELKSPSTGLRRIWWCPTGPFAFLPIHAAGVYQGKSRHSLLDHAISSYIPNISTLIDKMSTKPSSSSILLVSQSSAPELPRIPGTDEETEALSSLMEARGIGARRIFGKDATVNEVLSNMGSYGAIHLACHGSQVAGKPLDSGFYFRDGSLTISEIIKQHLPNADFAFLSACQTSTGDHQLSEEAVHLAGGMLAAGYRSVVGTMWAIRDNYAKSVAEDFYEKMLERSAVEGAGARLDGAQAAYALHHAIQQLRAKVGDSPHGFLTWVPYVHFGV